MEETKIFLNALNLIPELGSVKLKKLWQVFGSGQAAWEAGASQLRTAGLEPKLIEKILAHQAQVNPRKAYQELDSRGIRTVCLAEPEYPALLKEITSPPPLLYVRGELSGLNRLALSVVGTRKISLYGKQVVQELIPPLAQAGLTIVSGLAYGVDAEALHECLKASGTPVAVLASAIDNQSISPRVNYNLAQKIITAGCLLSEYPLGAMVQKQNFPIRNRLISGLTTGTLVIEADEESGALITAGFALEQNREVFAAPGSIFSPVSRGTNNLIKQGAKLISSARDILEELNLDTTTALPEVNYDESQEESLILLQLSRNPTHIDELIKQTKLPAAQTNAVLSMLEMKGRIKNLGHAHYVKLR